MAALGVGGAECRTWSLLQLVADSIADVDADPWGTEITPHKSGCCPVGQVHPDQREEVVVIEVLTTCTRCDADISVDMASAVLRMDVVPRAEAELLYTCPSCELPASRRIAGDLLTKLLFVGVQPLRLSEPSLPADDLAPATPPLTRDDLLDWHQDLAPIWTVIPWER